MRPSPPSNVAAQRTCPGASGVADSAVWDRYRDNTARHLIGIARDLQNRTMRKLSEERGYVDLRPSLGPLLSLVALEARPLGTLAAQLAVSPQACSQLVNIGESAGYVTRQQDPEDRRSRLVALTSRGQNLVEHASEIIGGLEAEYERLIGTDEYEALSHALGELFRSLGISGPRDLGFSQGSAHSMGALPLISVFAQQTLMKATAGRGHAGLKMSHAQVLPLIGADGARVTELARIQRVSRQAISATARDLEQLGYLRREDDPGDRRGVVFRLTAQGTRLIEASVSALDELDALFLTALGARRLIDLQGAARNLYQSLHLEEEIFEARVPADRGDTGDDRAELHLEQLAANLRRTLGAGDAARLAALLDGPVEIR